MTERERRIDEAITAYLQELEEGRPSDRSDFLARYADIAKELTAFLNDRAAFQQRAGAAALGADLLTVRYFGDYELLQEIDRGGMGVVYRARQVSLNRVVALKMMLSPQQASAEELRRFQAEVEAAANLDHPNIVPIYEVGEHDGQPYFSMKLIDGGNLSTVCPILNTQSAVRLLAAVARAVHHAHQRGILHRDLKPGNILLDRDGQPHVTDFGLAKRVGTADGQTRTGAIVGTPAYMAPEQARSEKAITVAADVYGLGAVLYELLIGRVPFQGVDVLDTLQQVVSREPPPLRSLNPKVPRDLETVCLKCLQKEPTRRYATAGELAEDLERFLVGEPIQARPVGPVERLGSWARRRPALAAVYGLLAVVLLVGSAGGIAAWLWRQAEVARIQLIREKEQTNIALQAAEEARKAESAALKTVRIEHERAEQMLYLRQISLAEREWENAQVNNTVALLNACPSERRGWEWYYLHRLSRGTPATMTWGAGAVYSLAFSPDGRRIVTTGGVWPIEHISVWDALTGRESLRLLGSVDRAHLVAFSPDGQSFATGSWSGDIRVWDAQTGKNIRHLLGHRTPVRSLAFSTDGHRVISSGEDRTVRHWDTDTGTPILTLDVPHARILNTALSRDGKRLATVSRDGTVKLWDANTGTSLGSLQGPTAEIRTIAFGPDAKRLVTGGSDHRVRLWDAPTGLQTHALQGHSGAIESVAFSPDGRYIASGGVDRTVRVWDAQAGDEIRAYKGHTHTIMSVGFSPDGQRIASGSGDHTVRVWDARTVQDRTTLPGHAKDIRNVAFSPDGKQVLSVGGQWALGEVHIVDVESGRVSRTFKGHTSRVTKAVFSPNGQHVASVGWDGKVRVWEKATGKEILTLTANPNRLTCVAYSPDGRRVAAGGAELDRAGEVKVWDAQTGRLQHTLRGHKERVNSVAFSPDGQRIASGSDDGRTIVWEVQTGTALLNLHAHDGPVHCVTFSPDGRSLVSAGDDGVVQIWDAHTGRATRTMEAHSGQASSVVFSPDGKRIVSAGSDEFVNVWDPQSEKRVMALQAGLGAISSLAFSPDGRRLVAGSYKQPLRVWDARSDTDTSRLEELKAFWQDDPEWHNEQARLAEAQNDWFAAGFHLDRSIAQRPNNVDAIHRRAMMHIGTNSWRQAAADYARLVELSPSRYDLGRLARVQLIAGEEEAFRRTWRRLADEHAARHAVRYTGMIWATPSNPGSAALMAQLAMRPLPLTIHETDRVAEVAMLRPSTAAEMLARELPTSRFPKALLSSRAGLNAQVASSPVFRLTDSPDVRRCLGQFLLAMHEHKRGRIEAARAAYGRVNTWLNAPSTDNPKVTNVAAMPWYYRIDVELLRRETEEQLGILREPGKLERVESMEGKP